MRRTLTRASLLTAINLLVFAVIGTAVLAFTHDATRATIARSVENEKLKLVAQVAPQAAYDNDIMQDAAQLAPDELLGTTQASTAYRGRLHGQPSIAVLEAVAPDGYSGRINLLIAIHYDGRIGGVRVVSHKETPGLGDYIEIARDSWITGFNDASLESRKDEDWKVSKDGGAFDYRAGATITPRAVVMAVHKTLQYFAQHRDELFAQNTPTPPGLPLSGEETARPSREGFKEDNK